MVIAPTAGATGLAAFSVRAESLTGAFSGAIDTAGPSTVVKFAPLVVTVGAGLGGADTGANPIALPEAAVVRTELAGALLPLTTSGGSNQFTSSSWPESCPACALIRIVSAPFL